MVDVDISEVRYFGHDELSTATRTSPNIPYDGQFMADDFADRDDRPVVHVRWWGSYIQNQTGEAGVQKFLIAWEHDVPAGPSRENPFPFSLPGELIQHEVVTRDATGVGPVPVGTFREASIHPGGPPLGEELFEYNAELALPFDQDPDTVYWLKIVALVDVVDEGFIQWGWHNRDYTLNDPLASVPPGVIPGEHDDQPIVDPLYPTEVWHFQDDAVTGHILALLSAAGDDISQDEISPTTYLNGVDGPSANGHGGIGQFSKDLAFELFAVPEPGSIAMGVIALAGLLACAYRHRRG
jgi:hypothetical protein